MINTERIRELTKQDSKTIIQRALKLCEETGELAGAILGETQAPGCEYKEFDRSDVLEELADVTTLVISLTETYGFTDEELQAAISKKCDKWHRVINWSEGN